MSKIKFLLIGGILILGFFLRFYGIEQIPTGFFADEAANGYNAYKVLTSGKDEYEVSFPFYFRSFGDFRTPVAIYSMIPWIALFGLNEFSVRMTMVIYGTLTIFFLFLLVSEIVKKLPFYIKNVTPYISALLLAISPWHIHFSRSGFEFIPMPFFITLGLFFIFRFFNEPLKKRHLLLLGALFLIVGFYTAYVVQLVFLPFLIGIIIIYFPIFLSQKNTSLMATLIIVLGLIPFALAIHSGQALTRFNSVSPLAQGKSLGEVLIPMTNTYIQHFSFDFLFSKGDINMPGHFITRHSVKGLGELYLFQLPLIIGGVLYIIKKQFKLFLFLLLWLILYPIGSTAVAEGPFAHRSLFGVIPFQILSGLGFAILLHFFRQYSYKLWGFKLQYLLFLVLGLIIFSASLKNYTDKYFNQYPLYSADYWGWQYGPKETIEYFLSVKNNYDELYMSGEFNSGDIFLKFYDPNNLCQNKCMLGDFWRNPKIYNPKKRQLFSLSPEYLKNSSLSNRFLVKRIIFYPNKTIAFQIGEIVQ